MGASFGHKNKYISVSAVPTEKHRHVKTPAVKSPEYRFGTFVGTCENMQHEKVEIESRLRTDLQKWRRNGLEEEDKREVYGLLKRFRQIQEQQTLLLHKEKMRLQDMTSQQSENGNTSRRLRNRLKYFTRLNKQHEDMISKVRESSIGCRWVKQEGEVKSNVLKPKWTLAT
ncbi:uncharacterized protein LOC130613352 isoform X2 [Hydractinia symbiolongicarpus]|uniref:uncharacterized protein LOC130613352 isoform X2 n=1 Tax=Hydractinia symbiolongicarpus TaxID=13093 RepID=UPI00254ADAB7|nr:uncharacterized protein LOC130613352 isoform X2 [Hydractinia symbiolongicarpus]